MHCPMSPPRFGIQTMIEQRKAKLASYFPLMRSWAFIGFDVNIPH